MIPSNVMKECLEPPMNQIYNHTTLHKYPAIMPEKTRLAPVKTVMVHMKNNVAPDWVGNGGINTGIINLEEVI